jgi:hypothetical protein
MVGSQEALDRFAADRVAGCDPWRPCVGAPGRPVNASEGSPRPMCASTATACPRTPTMVTPMTLRQRTSPFDEVKVREAGTRPRVLGLGS